MVNTTRENRGLDGRIIYFGNIVLISFSIVSLSKGKLGTVVVEEDVRRRCRLDDAHRALLQEDNRQCQRDLHIIAAHKGALLDRAHRTLWRS